MAYQEYTITTIADIPSIVASFAANMGWDVAAGPVLRHPNYKGLGPGGLAFALTATISGLNHDLKWTCTTDATRSAACRSPIFQFAVTPNGVTQTPTKLYLIGMLAPEPYIAIVIEYGYNLYRHLYLGYMEKQGVYDGGMCVSAVNGPTLQNFGDYHWLDNRNTQYLFKGHSDSGVTLGDAFRGGVEVIAAENPTSWRRFNDKVSAGFAGESQAIGQGNFEVYGGFGDGFNEGYVAKGKNRIAGANILAPINLYISRKITNDWRARGIGRPTGVRMINIDEIDPQATFDVGGETWHSFAARAKDSRLYDARFDTGSRYRLYETSYFLGYAYRG